MTSVQIVGLVIAATGSIVFTLIAAAWKVGGAFAAIGCKVDVLTLAIDHNATETKENRKEMAGLREELLQLRVNVAVLEEKTDGRIPIQASGR